MDPVDYSSSFSSLPAPTSAFTQGLQTGNAIDQLQQARQQQQAAVAQQQQKQAVLSDLVAKGAGATADDYVKAGLQVPELSAQFKQFWDMKNTAQQQNELQRMTSYAAAIDSGQPKVASDAMRAQADAIENTAGSPTPESQGLRAKADQVDANPQAANVILKSMIAANPNGPKVLDAIQSQNLAPAAVRKANADATTAEAGADEKNFGIVAQQAGALAKPGVKPEQAITMFKSLEARGIIPKGGAQAYIDGMPTDPAALPDYLASVRDAGIKPDDQKKFTTPTADAALSAKTQVQTTGMNNSTQLAVQDRIDARAKAESEGGDDVASFTPQAIDNAAARYNLDGTLPPMGMGKAASAGRTAILNRAAELKAGIDPEQQRRDQLANKGDIASQNKAVREFTSGKLGSSVRSFNVGISHLDTLGHLADALGNGDTQGINRLGNYFATQTGSPAPTSFNAAKKIVGDEIVKAIVGSGGGVHDREEAARVIDAANSPAQLKAAIDTYKELMVGQLGGLDRQYSTSTGRADFHKFLSPQAQALYSRHGGSPAPAAPAASTLPAGWSVQVH